MSIRTLRAPRLTDGPAVHRLIARCPPLDANSRYCNLLQCTHFADTSVVAERDGQVVGFVSAYLDPRRRDTLFVWQVAVAPECRRQGLAGEMLSAVLARNPCRRVTHVETSITPDNRASWRSFRAVAREWGADIAYRRWFEREPHFEGEHDSEFLLRIGPIAATALRAEAAMPMAQRA
jgi:L-2,4-diaminobutyric acid acetyltransferase